MEFLSNKPLLITDTILRDAHQSQAVKTPRVCPCKPLCALAEPTGREYTARSY